MSQIATSAADQAHSLCTTFDPSLAFSLLALSPIISSRRARLKFMARFTSMLKLRASNLWEIATVLKAGVKEESNHRRIRHFLSEYEVGFAELGRLLVRLLPQKPPYKAEASIQGCSRPHGVALWIDPGERPNEMSVLMVGVAHKGIAFPVSWTVLPSGGSSSAEDHRRALRRFLEGVDPEDIEVVLADREFISTEWLRWLQTQEIPFALRLRSDRKIGLSPEVPSLLARMFARPLPPRTEKVHTEKVLDGTRHLFGTDGEHVGVKVVMRRIAAPSSGEDQFLVLATWGVDPNKATTLYEKRWEIETIFAVLKSWGYRLEQTHLTEPDRIQRLIGLLTLTFAWTYLVGKRRANREGPPRRTSHGRHQRSLVC